MRVHRYIFLHQVTGIKSPGINSRVYILFYTYFADHPSKDILDNIDVMLMLLLVTKAPYLTRPACQKRIYCRFWHI